MNRQSRYERRYRYCAQQARSVSTLKPLLLLTVLSGIAVSAPITVINSGAPANRVDIVFVGDGYTQADLNAGLYNQHVDSYLDHMFVSGGILADPFPRYRNFFNAHKITVASNESGADIPSQSIFRDTALDATYETFGADRFLSISATKADALVASELAGTDIDVELQLATVNHSKYGGAFFNDWAVYAGANVAADEFELHEVGHAIAGLNDEYGGTTTPYSGPELTGYPNVTKDPTGQKWAHWLGFVDSRDASLTIGVHEGAAGYNQGLYRPSENSKMRSLYRPFDAVGREAIIQSIYSHVDPLDDWLENETPIVATELWTDVVDPDVIKLEWYMDDSLVAGANYEQFRPREYGFGPGTYTVRVRTYDEVLDHAFTGDTLDMARIGLDDLEQTISWTLTIPTGLPADYDGDGLVDADDRAIFQQTFGSTQLLAADGSGNGVIDVADYVMWRKLFAPLGAGTSSEAIPEPAAAASLLVVLLCHAAVQRPLRRIPDRHKPASFA